MCVCVRIKSIVTPFEDGGKKKKDTKIQLHNYMVGSIMERLPHQNH